MKLRIVIALMGALLIANVSCTTLNAGDSKDQQIDSANVKLDLLTDYDRDIWGGPDAWSQEQWHWKRLLNWSKDCDYLGDVQVFPVSDSQQLVQIICVPGSYQPMQYLYLFNPKTHAYQQLALGDEGNTDNANEINGRIGIKQNSNILTILTLSRGKADCGMWRKFELHELSAKLIEIRSRSCSAAPLPENPLDSMLNPEKWPTTKNLQQ